MSWHPVRDVRCAGAPPEHALAYPGDSRAFEVEEIPLYLPSGEGEHLYLWIEKRDLDTPSLAARLAERCGVEVRDIGWAGRKDARSLARQWLSLPLCSADLPAELLQGAEGTDPDGAIRPGVAVGDLAGATMPDAAETDGQDPTGAEGDDPAAAEDLAGRWNSFLGLAQARVIVARRHRNKLRLGHSAGNRFRLLLRGEAELVPLAAALERLSSGGLPNYFGFQRFGDGGDNHIRGLAILERGGRPRGRRGVFLTSAYQSALFNRVLDERVDALGELMAGDMAWIHAKGALFLVEDPELEQPRATALEISPSGPLPGRKTSPCSGLPGEIEARILAEGGWRPGFEQALTGGRRPLRVPVGDASLEPCDEGFELRFSLPPGTYASVLLAELGVAP